jgi:hypothetical protein
MITIGVDIGQKRDPTAFAVVERDPREVEGGRTETHFLVRYLDRLPLGTPYPEVARRVAGIAERAGRQAGSSVTVYLDATGVGQPVVDLVAERWRGGRLVAVYFTHGDRRTEDGGKVTLGKAYLVSKLQALLQTQRIHLPDSSEGRVLAQELQDYEIRVGEDANDRYGAFRVGTHDDLVTALGLAVHCEPHVTVVFRGWSGRG